LALALAATLAAQAPTAADIYLRGRRAERAGRMAEAYILYSQAAAMAPENRTYWLRSQAVRTRAALEAKVGEQPLPQVDTSTSDAADEDPAPPIPEATLAERRQARPLLPTPELKAKAGTQSFDIRGNARDLYEKVARAYDLGCVFDEDFNAPAQIRFDVKDLDYRDALHALEAATGSFIVAVNERLFLAVKDTPQKRTEREPTAAIELRLPEAATQQDFNTAVTAVQQAFAIEKVAFDTQNNSVILRDRISKVIPARLMFQDLMSPRAEVVIEVRFLEVTRNDAITYGIALQNSFSLTALSKRLHNIVTVPTNVAGLITFGGGKTLMGIGIINDALVAKMSEGSSKLLLETELRSADNMPATFHVGDKYPILTSGYFGPQSFYQGTGSTAGQTAYTPPPAFTFEDLGLTLKVTPSVHGTDGVAMDIESEFKVLGGGSINGIPVVSNRSFKSRADLQAGEWAAIAGLMETREAHSIAGVAGLSRIPFLAPLTSTHDKNSDSSQVLLLVRPHLVSLPSRPGLNHAFRIGTENRPLTPL
jgi:hypothetical protein